MDNSIVQRNVLKCEEVLKSYFYKLYELSLTYGLRKTHFSFKCFPHSDFLTFEILLRIYLSLVLTKQFVQQS